MQSLGDYVELVSSRNTDQIGQAAEAIVRTASADGLVRPTGAGHSLAAVLETFFRAGGLAFIRPLWDPRILPLYGARASTTAEREVGLGATVAAEAGVTAEDTVVVFSNSGANPFPIEVATAGRDAGATVVAVTSRAANEAAPRRASHRLIDLADIVIDTAVPAGDATWPPEDPVTAPVSSLATTTVWTHILRRVYELAPEAPRWRSANVAGNDDFNRELVARFSGRIPEL